MLNSWTMDEIKACLIAKDLSSQDREIRKEAEKLLLEMGEKSIKAIDELIKESPSAIAKLRGLEILKLLGGEKIISTIIYAANDRHLQVRQKAIALLGEIKCEDAIPHLVDKLKLVDPVIRNDAKKALKNMGKSSITPLLYAMLEANVRLYQSAEEIILSLKNQAEDLLMEKINDRNYLIRCFAVKFLGKLKCTKSKDVLLNILQGEDGLTIKQEALISLGELGDDSVMPEVAKYIKDNEPLLREAAAISIGKLKDVRYKYDLITLLSDSNEKVVIGAIKSFGLIKDKETVPYLIPFLEHPAPAIREEVLKSLVFIGDKDTEPLLIKKLDDENDYVKEIAIRSMGMLKIKNSLPKLINFLQKDEKPFLRIAAAEILGDMGDEYALKYLIETLNDEDIFLRKISARSLALLGGKDSLEALEKRLAEEAYLPVISAIENALERLRKENL